jgi:hypothetical protein
MGVEYAGIDYQRSWLADADTPAPTLAFVGRLSGEAGGVCMSDECAYNATTSDSLDVGLKIKEGRAWQSLITVGRGSRHMLTAATASRGPSAVMAFD